MTIGVLRKELERAAKDPDIVELAEWGMNDYAEIIAGTARSMGVDAEL